MINIDIPKIAEPWDWMQDSLRVTFYRIFEKELRVSIVPYLISQYQGNFIPVTLEKEDDSRKEVKKFMINQNIIVPPRIQHSDRYVMIIHFLKKILKNIQNLPSYQSNSDNNKNKFLIYLLNKKLFTRFN